MHVNPYESPRAAPSHRTLLWKWPGELYPGLYFGVLIQVAGCILSFASGLGSFPDDWNLSIGLVGAASLIIPGSICIAVLVIRNRSVRAVADKNPA